MMYSHKPVDNINCSLCGHERTTHYAYTDHCKIDNCTCTAFQRYLPTKRYMVKKR